MVVPSIRVITFQDLIRSVVVYFSTGTFPKEGNGFLGADIEAAPCLFCSKQSWAIKWQDVAWSFPFSGWFFQLLCTFLCAQGVLVLPVFCCCFFFFHLVVVFHIVVYNFCHVLSFLRSFFFFFTISTWLLCFLLWLWILVALFCIHLCPLNACGFVIVWVSSVRLQSLQSLHRESLIKYQLQWLHHRIFRYRYLLWNSRRCLHVFKRMLHTSLLKGTPSSPLSPSWWL